MSIKTIVTSKLGRQILLTQKHSPKILFVSGIVGIVTSGVLACRATLKLSDTLDDIHAEIDGVKEMTTINEYPKNEHGKDLAFVYLKSTGKLVKLYAPSVVLGTVSIAALTGSHVTLTRRNASVTAAYAIMENTFDEYRERVKAELGEDKEKNLLHGVTTEKVKIGGKTVEMPSVDPNKASAYSAWFHEGNINWVDNASMNENFIHCQELYFTHQLQSRGHVFLNEVYDHLGLPRTRAGQAVGWVLGNGDNYVSITSEAFEKNNFTAEWWNPNFLILDFNVDGLVLDLI